MASSTGAHGWFKHKKRKKVVVHEEMDGAQTKVVSTRLYGYEIQNIYFFTYITLFYHKVLSNM